MTRDDIATRVCTVLSDTFGADPATITDATTAADIPGWDSLSHLILIAGIEHECGFPLPLEPSMTAPNIGSLIDLIVQSQPA
ncbi:MAG TPA: phosphopantetheine-binding protein [Acidiphilium sp.]|nr:MAG: hypothetical protein B7Z67_12895 [Acidiphilium sp. 21-60-14]OZB40149.1 MAG: hypothetical protein B7X48_06160 [Acidiphilium sp. 34-60-192]HQT87853.1 phosphopantetheine-binding protein [Acidiphilium sp.]HQU25072.1 phosphopantetheine-binding protein [Acidiphilium sp.]